MRTRTGLPIFFALLAGCILLAGCVAAETPSGTLAVRLFADGKQIDLPLPAGSTVQLALDRAGLTLGSLDRVEPPSFTLLTGPTDIRVTRVREVFEVEETILPFTRQEVKNESLPLNQQMIVQAGATGLMQATYRRVFENDVEISRTRIKTQTITEPQPEIVMIGVQSSFSPLNIPRKLAYITMGSAWLMQRTTAERRPLVTTGDLDSQIFSISPDGRWLLFTRKSARPAAEEINTLWVVSLVDDNPKPIDLKVKNVVLYAEWSPSAANTLYFSTVEPLSTSPGWKANNDLNRLVFADSGSYAKVEEVLPAGFAGKYGWWGTSLAWSPDGKRLAYARGDAIGLVNLEKKTYQPLLDLLPYQTMKTWAWVPGISWSPDGRTLFTVNHNPSPGLASPDASQVFDLSAILPDSGQVLSLSPQAGMFAYPSVSPLLAGKRSYVAFLRAYFPDQSETSRYRLVVMDRDGSNQRVLFPEEGATGLEPQQVVWSPPADDPPAWIALIYRGNLYLVNPVSGKSMQLTGDGLIKRIDWK